jgi:hypothetical protein
VLEDVADHEIERIARELRRPVDLGPAVDVAVMAALHAAPLMVAGRSPAAPVRRGGPLRWLTRSRTLRLRVSPIGGLVAAGLAIAAIFGLRRAEENRVAELRRTEEHPIPSQTDEFAVASRPGITAGQTRDTVVVTRFVFVAPDAKQVALAGDFNDWDTSKTQLVKSEHPGVWTTVLPLPAGRYSYAFVVDGERWVADPRAARAVGDDFDRPSSTITVREAQSL